MCDEIAKAQSEKEHHLKDIVGIQKTLENLSKVDGKLRKKQKLKLEVMSEKMQERQQNAFERIKE